MTIPLEADIGKDNDDAKGHAADLYACMSQQVYRDVGLGQHVRTYASPILKSSHPSRPLFTYRL